jgi:hypothetical protein
VTSAMQAAARAVETNRFHFMLCTLLCVANRAPQGGRAALSAAHEMYAKTTSETSAHK